MAKGQEPAYPSTHANSSLNGLSKRELIAKDILCAMLTSGKYLPIKPHELSFDAVKAADSLLSELEKPQS